MEGEVFERIVATVRERLASEKLCLYLFGLDAAALNLMDEDI